MFFFRKPKKSLLFELENIIKKEFSSNDQFTFWEKKTFKKNRIIKLIQKNNVFTGLFVYLKILISFLNKSEVMSKNFLTFYFQYSFLNEYIFSFKKYHFDKSKKWKKYISDATEKNEQLTKKLFDLKQIKWEKNSPLISNEQVAEIIPLVKNEHMIFFGNCVKKIFFKSRYWKKDSKIIARESFLLGYFLAGYLIAHYEINRQFFQKRKFMKKSLILKKNNNLFFLKMFFAKEYIEKLQFFFPVKFNMAIKLFNKTINSNDLKNLEFPI